MSVFKTILLVFLFGITLAACNSQKSKAIKTIVTPEFLGRWTDSVGCELELANNNGNLILVSFSNGQQHYANLPLDIQKSGVFTQIKSKTSSGIVFSGMFSDGILIMSNKLCKQALHKDSNQ